MSAPPSAPQCPPLPPAVPMSAYERSLCRFVDAGRSGRRNALPDIMAASSSVGTAGLSEQLAHALTLLGPGEPPTGLAQGCLQSDGSATRLGDGTEPKR